MKKHVIGTLVIHADATFLNGAGIATGGEDKNTVITKTLWQKINGRPTEIPYVSSQSFRRWLRDTSNEENNWQPSTLHSIGQSAKGSTNKISTYLDPVIYPEDDLFGYMMAVPAKKPIKSEKEVKEISDDQKAITKNLEFLQEKKIQSIQRTSVFRNSILKAIPGANINTDEAFVHLSEGTPVPYSTKFYMAHLQSIFGLDIERLGRFENIGSKVEIDPNKIEEYLNQKKIVETQKDNNKKIVYELSNRKNIIGQRISGLLKSLVRLRGGAKMAAFGADVTPKIIILAMLNGGNLIFNDLFEYGKINPKIKMDAFEDAIESFADRIDKNKIYVGYRRDYLENHSEIPEKINGIDIIKGNTTKVIDQFLKANDYENSKD